MPTAKKVQEVEQIGDLLKNNSLSILADYRGLSVADLQSLRAQLRQYDSNIRVVKNTLTAIAAENAGFGSLGSLLQGPTALVIGRDDPVGPAKTVNDFARTSRILQIKGGILDGRLISAQEVESLASLPSRDVLLGRVVGGMQAPLYGMVSVMSGVIRSLAYALQARADQLGGEQAPAS